MNKKFKFGISSTLLVSLFFLLLQPTFAKDVPLDVTGDAHEVAIRYLYDKNMVSGYPDGTFRPAQLLNRAELVAFGFMGKGIQIDAQKYKNCFPDVKTQWFASFVCYAKEKNWVSGYPDGLFRPGQSVKKVEAVAVLINMFGVSQNYSARLPYTDLGKDAWYLPYLRAAYQNSYLEETSGAYRPSSTISRGQVSQFAYRYFVTQNTAGAPVVVTPPVSTSSTVTPPVTSVNSRRRLASSDLQYVGAFKLPGEGGGDSRFGYGGSVMTFNPYGDPNGAADGYPGSLLIVGHSHDQLVAEVSIPAPHDNRTESLADLPVAGFVNKFADVTGGLAKELDAGNGFRVAGLAVLEPQGDQTKPKIYWTARSYYNVDGSIDKTHGMSDLNFANFNAKGLWKLGNFHSNMTAGYIFTVPHYFADVYLAGKRLISGLYTHQGIAFTSQGPAFYAYAPWQSGLPADGTKLPAQELVSYPYTDNFTGAAGIDPVSNFPDHQIPDFWGGATWVDTPNAHAVVVAGTRAIGDTYYGVARPNDCTIDKGYHGTPYEPRLVFYDPADLALVTQGIKKPSDVVPYFEFNPAQYFIRTCDWTLSGISYDSEHRLLYVIQQKADTEGEPSPVVYVFRVNA